MDPDDIIDEKEELIKLLENYDVEDMDTPFREWFQRAIEQEISGGWGAYKREEKTTTSNKHPDTLKVGDLVKRTSSVSEGTTGVITRVDVYATNKSHGKIYLVTLQQDGSQAWFDANQLEKVA